jgi:hypothetical protein
MSEVLCLAEVLGEYDYVVDVDGSVLVQVAEKQNCWFDEWVGVGVVFVDIVRCISDSVGSGFVLIRSSVSICAVAVARATLRFSEQPNMD